MYADVLTDGSSRGGGLSAKSVRNVHVIIRKALGDATRKRLVSRNVALDADAPKVPGPADRDFETWTPEELRAFIDGTKDHWLASAFLLAAATGMRRGEVLGLRWEDLDVDGGTIAIRRNGYEGDKRTVRQFPPGVEVAAERPGAEGEDDVVHGAAEGVLHPLPEVAPPAT